MRVKRIHVFLGAAAAVLSIGCSGGSAEFGENALDQDAIEAPRASNGEAASPGGSTLERHEPRYVVIPAGTTVQVRTTSTISTKSSAAGEEFIANLEAPLVAGDGSVVAPKGSRVIGRVAFADDGGRVKGVSRLGLTVSEVTLENGRALAVSTGTFVREAKATKGNDAKKIGIGSGIGAAIGAIAGGGSGAAKGAAVGAGAGTGVVLATHGDPAVVGSESVLNFRLSEDARLEM